MGEEDLLACELDHIVIGASSLETGVRFIRDRLGVDIGPGGKHDRMGTHNRLMRLGDDCYLEVIAVDPEAPAPARPRWYGLDEQAILASLAAQPQLLTWVVRCADIDMQIQAATVSVGAILPLSRGTLRWQLTVPDDGHLPGGGVVPHIIEWDSGVRPWETMTDPGCRLVELTLTHPDPLWLADALASLGAPRLERVSVRKGGIPSLTARIATPSGAIVTL